MNRIGTALFGVAVALGCGGAQPTTKKEMSKMAREAPPPPENVKPNVVVERKVTTEAKADFSEAVAFFQKAAEGGWTTDECTAAAQKFKDVASQHDKMVEAYFNAGVAYQMCNDTKHAEDLYQQALKINPSHAPSLANLGEMYLAGGNDSLAEQYFTKAITADAQVTGARNNLAWLLYQKMRRDPANQAKYEPDALGHLQRVLAVDNDNVVAYTLMAMIFMEGSEKNKNRLDVANLLLQRGMEKNDHYAQLYNAKGLLALRKADIAKALDAFKKARDLDPKMIECRLNLAQIVLSFRKYDDAETYFREVLALNPDKTIKYDATVGLGVSLRGQGSVLRSQGNVAGSDQKINDAEAQYKAAIDIDGKRGDAYFNMGLLYNDYRTNGQPADNRKAYLKAKEYFQKFVAQNDGTPDKMDDAKDHIEDCDKYVAILDKVIQEQNAPPPPTTPTPPPATQPAGGAGAGAGAGGATTSK